MQTLVLFGLTHMLILTRSIPVCPRTTMVCLSLSCAEWKISGSGLSISINYNSVTCFILEFAILTHTSWTLSITTVFLSFLTSMRSATSLTTTIPFTYHSMWILLTPSTCSPPVPVQRTVSLCTKLPIFCIMLFQNSPPENASIWTSLNIILSSGTQCRDQLLGILLNNCCIRCPDQIFLFLIIMALLQQEPQGLDAFEAGLATFQQQEIPQIQEPTAAVESASLDTKPKQHVSIVEPSQPSQPSQPSPNHDDDIMSKLKSFYDDNQQFVLAAVAVGIAYYFYKRNTK